MERSAGFQELLKAATCRAVLATPCTARAPLCASCTPVAGSLGPGAKSQIQLNGAGAGTACVSVLLPPVRLELSVVKKAKGKDGAA